MKVHTAPTELPVTVTQLAYNLRIVTTDAVAYTGVDAGFLERLIESATKVTEERIQSGIMSQKHVVEYDKFEDKLCLGQNVKSVDSVKYYDENGVQQTWGSDNYIVHTSPVIGSIEIKGSATIPSLYDRENAIEIIYTVGEVTADTVDSKIKQAIILLASHFYQNRESTSALRIRTVPLSYEYLIGGSGIAAIG